MQKLLRGTRLPSALSWPPENKFDLKPLHRWPSNLNEPEPDGQIFFDGFRDCLEHFGVGNLTNPRKAITAFYEVTSLLYENMILGRCMGGSLDSQPVHLPKEIREIIEIEGASVDESFVPCVLWLKRGWNTHPKKKGRLV